MRTGKIIQVSGSVVDVRFPHGELPRIREALSVELNGKRLVMEVEQHLSAETVRCIMLSGSEGLSRGMTVTGEGSGLRVPVGKATLGRLFNVFGDTIDGGAPIGGAEPRRSIHRKPPAFDEQSPSVEILETGIKVIDLLEPYPRGGKIGLFGGAGKRCSFRSLSTTSPSSTAAIRSSPAWASAAARATTSGTRCTRAALSTRPRSSSAR